MEIAAMATTPKDGHRAGLELLEKLYSRRTGEKMPGISRGEWGKPYFENSPFYFSVTHTKRHAFCALAQGEIGIDAEEIDRKIDLRLAEKILSPKEYEAYENALDKPLALLTFWVLKEAYAKYTGKGLQGYPKDTDFSLSDERVYFHEGCILAIISDDKTKPEFL